MRINVWGGLVIAITIAAVAGCGGRTIDTSSGNPNAGNTVTTTPRHLHQPSVAELLPFAPGGVDVSRTAKTPVAAPLTCGGTVASRLIAKTVVEIPNTLSRIAVLRYQFADPSHASAYFDALRALEPRFQSQTCRPPANADSGVFLVGALIAFAGSGTADEFGTITYRAGPWAAGYQYYSYRRLQQGRDVYLIELARQHGEPGVPLVDAVENVMNTSSRASSASSAPSSPASTVTGVLERGWWHCCSTSTDSAASGVGEGPMVNVESKSCPDLIVSGTHYTLRMAGQLPNVQANGLVARSKSGALVTIPWGAHVTVVAESFENAAGFGCLQPKAANGEWANAISVSPSQ